MLRKMMLTWTAVLVIAHVPQAAADPAPAGDPDALSVETTEVKTRKAKELDHASLRFLRDNRDFLRAQLDRLRLETRRERRGAAEDLDPRHLRLREMAAAIAAARDTVDREGAALDRRELLASVAQLGDLELQLDLMDSLLVDQGRRLGWLEADFLGRQETALVVLVRGTPRQPAPTGLVLTEEGESLHVELGAEQRASLARGGIIQIDHRLIEPRAHDLTVSFTGEDWEGRPGTVVQVQAPRDKLTFLELDLSGLDPDPAAAALAVEVWQR